ncbi:ABC transporter permease [Brevibacterium yomogidense]|uniref:ABC transporter permease n=1 Tax=Brevibacterium yomogidense TaxID=946573 RepID=UPI0018E044AF|nr:ABC transporter permease [Brevibacterium yomogidense]
MTRPSREHTPGVPAALLPLALVGAAVVVLPVAGLALRVPWSDFWRLVTADDSLTALQLSLVTALVSASVCVLLGVPLGMVLARSDSPLLRTVRAFVLLPVVLPPVVGGLALLATFGRRGILAAPLEATGIDVAFTTTAVICAQVFVSLPFVVMGVEAAMRTHGTDFETAAAVLGASPGRAFAVVTLPLLLPAIASSAVLSFARSLGEFGATLTFAGSLAGTTRTLPLEIYLRRETDPDAAVAVSMLLVAIALIVVLVVYSLPRSGSRPAAPTAPAAEAPSPDLADLTTVALPASRHPSPPRLTVAFDAPDRGIAQSFTVEPGETLALTGPNGAGKSTALAVTAGLLVPPAAHVRVDDRTLTQTGHGLGNGDVPPHRRGVTLLLQDPRLFPHMTAVGNIAFGLRTAGTTGGQATERAHRMLDDLGIGHLAKARPRSLSGGQRARVALARALATDPQVVLLDEPSAALDAESAPAIRALLAALLAGRTCVLVSHDPTEVDALAQRVIRLDRA